jgi:hypothetical protein
MAMMPGHGAAHFDDNLVSQPYRKQRYFAARQPIAVEAKP